MSTDNRETLTQIQRFTVSSISLLNLLQTACNAQDKTKLDAREQRSIQRFMDSSQKFIDNMKDSEVNFDYTRFIKKAFSTLRTEEHCTYIREKNAAIFDIRDTENKIVTILPGIDIKVGYRYLGEPESINFWQYMYLFVSSVFNLIKSSNEEKFTKHPHLSETLTSLEEEMAKTGIMFNNQIFNPFIGVGNDRTDYSVNDMFTGGPLPNKQNVTIDSVLSMLGVDKMFDEKKLNEELKNIGEDQINEATDRIVSMLGASNNQEVKEVCNVLIKDIVQNFKENGIGNVSDTLKRVAENAKKNIEINKMKKTAESMKFFMANSQEKMKDMKDSNGNPVGQQILNSMSVPMSMMNLMNFAMPKEALDDGLNQEQRKDNVDDTVSTASTKSKRGQKSSQNNKSAK